MDKPVIKYETYEKFIDAFEQAKTKYKAKKIYDEFPSTQKKFININNKEELNLLSMLYDDTTKMVFIKKISAYNNKNQLLTAITKFINAKSEFVNKFNDTLKILNENKLPIIYQDSKTNLIIAQVLNFKQCSIVGSRTSWCIASAKQTFKSYVPNGLSRQYIIYQIDKPETDMENIIGATFNIKGYRTAHDISNNHISYDKLLYILAKKDFDIDNLKIKKENLTLNDINNTNIKDLLNIKFTEEEILNKKQRYDSNDLKLFTKEQIEKYDLLNKTIIDDEILKRYSNHTKFIFYVIKR
jgi:hypothetical protein